MRAVVAKVFGAAQGTEIRPGTTVAEASQWTRVAEHQSTCADLGDPSTGADLPGTVVQATGKEASEMWTRKINLARV